MKLCLRRLTLAATLAFVPVLAFGGDESAAKAKFGDWLHDEMQHRGLWLYGSPNLVIERAPANLPPRSPGKRWLLSRDAATGAVVYFVPGDIRAVEIDSHRKVGTTADLIVSISPDGKDWLPLTTAIATLEVAGEWEYRLIAAETIPEGITHLRIEFPADTKPPALRLTEVWIRFEWEKGLLDDKTKATPAVNSTPSTSTAAATATPTKPAEPIITFLEPVAAKSVNAETPKDHSLALAGAKENSPASANVATTAESSVHSLALVATPEPASAVQGSPPSPPAMAVESPREIPMAPVGERAFIAQPAPATNAVEVNALEAVKVDPTPATQATAVVSVIPTASSVTQVSDESAAPAVESTKALKKAAKKSAVSRGRRGPRSK